MQAKLYIPGFLGATDPNNSVQNGEKKNRCFGGLTVKMLCCGHNDPGSTPGRGNVFYLKKGHNLVLLYKLFFS